MAKDSSKYDPVKVEKKWQSRWDKTHLYRTDLKKAGRAGKKYYNLVMFPYPSGDKLHIGHWYNYAPADSWGRFMRMQGFNVFEPMGFDAFGLPAENYAIKHGIHPTKSIAKNVKQMIVQLKRIGVMYDWDKMVNTSDPEYYRWTQWVFLQMYKHGLAERRKAPVNWCPSCQTVLANEQVNDGKCERCSTEVTKKDLTQWFWKISDYAEKLLDHSGVDWPEKTVLMQKNWIGRSEGINIWYDIEGFEDKITVYTTRPDTNFGATFIVVAPESEFVRKHFKDFTDQKGVQKYIAEANKKTDIERIAEGKKKTGVATGLFAVNHLTKRKMPIYVSDFVLAHVGTGCVVGVPGHDIRDFEFAQEKELAVIRVVIGSDGDTSPITKKDQVQEENGTMIHSDFLDGMEIHEATQAIMDHIEKKGWGKRVVNYKLRDWLISRQRYWGAPIPIVYCEKCGEVPVPEKDLPVKLPTSVDFKPNGSGQSPLATAPRFVNTKCPKCGGKAARETDTMDTFVCSSFYYLRYLDSKNKKQPWDVKQVGDWMPVDMYIGGPEHACMHLLYARFVYKVLSDLGHVPKSAGYEPFKRLIHQGLVTYKGAKMSKSKGNVVSPDDFVNRYGSDVFRLYLMFMGPFTDGGDWSDQGITGVARFVERFYAAMTETSAVTDEKGMKRLVHKAVKRVSEDIGALHFNTALAGLMEFVNAIGKTGIDREHQRVMCRVIAPIAPHLAEEIWEKLGGKKSVFFETYPTFDEKYLVEDTVTLAVQINGKFRAKLVVDVGISQEDVMALAKADADVQRHIEGKQIVKEIYVPGKIVNLVVRE